MPKLKDSFTFRLDLELSRKFRTLAKVYGALPGEFVRDLLEATIEEGLHKQLFDHRLQKGMLKYKDKPVILEDGGFTAPFQSALKAPKAKKRKKEPNVP